MTVEREKRHQVIPSAYLIVLNEKNEVLLMRRRGTGYMDGYYGFPSGHFDGDEEARVAVLREACEETGITVEIDDLEEMNVMHRKTKEKGVNERVDFFFVTRKWEGEPEIMELDKCDHLAWFSIDDLPDKMIPYSRVALCYCLRGIPYSGYGWREE